MTIDPVQTAADIATLLQGEGKGFNSLAQRLALTEGEREAITRLIPVATAIIQSPQWTTYINQFNQS